MKLVYYEKVSRDGGKTWKSMCVAKVPDGVVTGATREQCARNAMQQINGKHT